MPDAAWLVALFSSTVCDSCQGSAPKLAALESADVATCEIEAEERGDLHRRYELAAIPTTVVADADGVVRRALRRRVHRHRPVGRGRRAARPGSTPEPDLGELTAPARLASE